MSERNDILKDMPIVDSHCHILPGIDDGSKSMEETLSMLRIAKSEGVTHIIATPHFKVNHKNASLETRKKTLEKVRALAKENDIDINLFLGNELMFFNDIESVFEEKKICTMNGTHYLLTEFYPEDEFAKIRRGLEAIFELGLIPVLAHAERYTALRKSVTNTALLADMGVVISINASSVAGKAGFGTKLFVKKLIKERIVTLISSDAHDDIKRAPVFADCIRNLNRIADEEYIKDILYNNAMEMFELKR